MADHEIEVSGKVGLPEVAGFAANLQWRWKSAWTSRTDEMVATIAGDAGVGIDELDRRLADNVGAEHVVVSALQNVAFVSDPEYLAALAHLAAGALDDAKLDEAGFLVSELIKLEPIGLRLLLRHFRFRPAGQTRFGRVSEGVSPLDADGAMAIRLEVQLVAERVGISLDITAAIIDRLATAGFIDGPRGAQAGNRPSSLAMRALPLMFPNLTTVIDESAVDDGPR